MSKKYFQLKGNLEKILKMKFYKTSLLKTANFTKYFFYEQLIQTAKISS